MVEELFIPRSRKDFELGSERSQDMDSFSKELRHAAHNDMLYGDMEELLSDLDSFERDRLLDAMGRPRFAVDEHGQKIPSIAHVRVEELRQRLGIPTEYAHNLKALEHLVSWGRKHDLITDEELQELVSIARDFTMILGHNIIALESALEVSRDQALHFGKVLIHGVSTGNTAATIEEMAQDRVTTYGPDKDKTVEQHVQDLAAEGYVPTLADEKMASLALFLDQFMKQVPDQSPKISPYGKLWNQEDAGEEELGVTNFSSIRGSSTSDLAALTDFFPPEIHIAGTYIGHLRDYIGYN